MALVKRTLVKKRIRGPGQSDGKSFLQKTLWPEASEKPVINFRVRRGETSGSRGTAGLAARNARKGKK